MTERYTVGIDFGTESGRAVLVDCDDGRELATAVYPVPQRRRSTSACRRPTTTSSLEPDWALQDPDDYLAHARGRRARAARSRPGSTRTT